MPRQVYRFKSLGGQPAPMVTLGIKLGDTWLPVEVYVDSGAAYTLLHARVADGVGFDFRSGRLTDPQVGDGTLIPAYVHSLDLQIGPERITAPVGFSASLGVPFNLLGREGVFSRFAICFHERQGIFSFET
jgi:hypothetical protein